MKSDVAAHLLGLPFACDERFVSVWKKLLVARYQGLCARRSRFILGNVKLSLGCC
jgi:hypothetical protein